MAQPRKSVEELMKEAYELKGDETKVTFLHLSTGIINNTGEDDAYYNIKVEDYLVSHKKSPKVFK